MTTYTDTIRHWAADTRRAGILAAPDGMGEIGLEAGEAGRRLAVRFTLRVRLDRVTDIRYQVFGCGFTMAACAAAADLAADATLGEAAGIDPDRIDRRLDGLPADRRYCAELASKALQAAVSSARNGSRIMQGSLSEADDHRPRVTNSDPVYMDLMRTGAPAGVTSEDRHLFACLLAVAVQESRDPATALGLAGKDLRQILRTFFPDAEPDRFLPEPESARRVDAPSFNDDLLDLLATHLPAADGTPERLVSSWLVRIIAARATQPGHLWIAMGLFERPQLSAAIRRHLPSLALANNRNMRWKRYLYKQLCERSGGVMCQTPNCADCSDYALCFTAE